MDYFKRHWDGGNSLSYAFLVNGSCINILFSAISFYAFVMPGASHLVSFMLWYYPLVLCVSIWQFVGIWRSADHYAMVAQSDPTKSKSWPRVVKGLLVVGIFLGWAKTATYVTSAMVLGHSL